MYHSGNLFGQTLLQDASSWVLLMLFNQRLDGFALQRSKYLDIAFSVVVAHVQPELVERVRRGALRIEPYVSALGLTKLLTVGLCDEGTGQGESLGLVAQCATDELGTGGHVTPLVVTTQLQLTALSLIQVQEVVALKQLIGKLGERESVARGTVQALLHALLRHHIVDGDVLAYGARKVEEGEILHPVVVVYHLGGVGALSVKVEELSHLLFDALLVMIQRLGVEQVTFLALA